MSTRYTMEQLETFENSELCNLVIQLQIQLDETKVDADKLIWQDDVIKAQRNQLDMVRATNYLINKILEGGK